MGDEMGLTTDRNDPGIGKILPTGQQEVYLVLSEEERAKGFVRPVRTTYQHVGRAGPKYSTRPLRDDEKKDFDRFGYIAFEKYPDGDANGLGRYWTQAEFDRVGNGCGSTTTMGSALAETYARNPSFYGGTFCCHCGKHFPVGRDGEFVWDGTNEMVGT